MNALQVSNRTQKSLIRRTGETNPALVYLAGLNTPGGRRVMRATLERVARLASGGTMGIETFAWSSLRFQHVAAIRAKLSETLKPATVNRYLCAIRGTLRAAWLLGQMTAEQYHKAAAVKGVRGETLPAGRGLSAGELSGLMATCAADHSPAGARDGAIIALAYAAGLRRAELAALTVADLDPATGELRVMGKGHKERTCWINNGALDALRDWLAIRGDAPGPLFLRINKAGRIADAGMTPQAIYNMLNKRATSAGVKRFSPHDLRRSFVSDLLDAGADLATVQRMAGHASTDTTARYDRRPEAAKQRAASLLHVPYYRRESYKVR